VNVGGGRRRRGPMSEINIVPYIDVMLVLLVIFMITTPLLTEGIRVHLPRAPAKPLTVPPTHPPIVLSVDRAGRLYLNIASHPRRPIRPRLAEALVAAVLRHDPGTAVVVKGDRGARYGRVVRAMVLLQHAGARSVGLMTLPSSRHAGGAP
jgi:biopolymer transport protein TolR